MPGGKKLCVPRTSESFKWNATEVISTAAQGALYIMATIHPLSNIKKESAVRFDSIFYMHLIKLFLWSASVQYYWYYFRRVLFTLSTCRIRVENICENPDVITCPGNSCNSRLIVQPKPVRRDITQ